MKNDLDDLINRLQKSDKEAFNILFYLYADKILNFAKSFYNDQADAEEVVQEVFLRIWLKRTEITNPKSFNAYIFTISKNFIFNNLRKIFHKKKYQEYAYKARSAGENTTLNDYYFEEMVHAINEFIDQFPPKRREVFLLSRKQGLTNQEIAEKLKISIKAVEYHISHSLKSLRKSLNIDPTDLIFLFLLGFIVSK